MSMFRRTSTYKPQGAAGSRGASWLRARARRLAAALANADGATGIEYGLIIGGIAIAILATVFAIGSQMDAMFSFIASLMHSSFSKI